MPSARRRPLVPAHLQQEPGLCRIPAAEFGRLPLALRVRILGTVIAHFGGSAARAGRAGTACPGHGGRNLSRRTLGGALAWRRQTAIPHRPRAGAHRSASGRRCRRRARSLGPALSGHGAARLDSFSRCRVRGAAALARRAGGGLRCPAGGETAGWQPGSGPARPEGGVTARFVAYLAA